MEAGDNLAQHQQDKEGKETDVCVHQKGTYITFPLFALLFQSQKASLAFVSPFK